MPPHESQTELGSIAVACGSQRMKGETQGVAAWHCLHFPENSIELAE